MSDWRFLLDENIDPKTGTYLQKEDVHAEHVRDVLWQERIPSTSLERGATPLDELLIHSYAPLTSCEGVIELFTHLGNSP